MKLGPVDIGPGHPCLVVAELGVNHDGNPVRAMEMVRQAHAAGCRAVKVQAYTTEEFCSPTDTLTYFIGRTDLREEPSQTFVGTHLGAKLYLHGTTPVTERQYDLFKRCELSEADLVALSREAHRLGMAFIATCTDAVWIDRMIKHVDAFKVGSDDLTNISLLAELARTGWPVILSTGMSVPAEVLAACSMPRLNVLAILHCVSLYPTPPEAANLAKMDAYRKVMILGKGGPLVGFSDHTDGTAVAIAAMCRGAEIVEKHFTLDKSGTGPDHRFSASPEELRLLCQTAPVINRMVGSEYAPLTTSEVRMRHQMRRSIVAARDLNVGEVINVAMLGFKRPGTGLPPTNVTNIVGLMVASPVKAGEQISMDQLTAVESKEKPN